MTASMSDGTHLTATTILWRRLDHPGHEFARVWHEGAGWRLAGVAVFAYDKEPCRLDYSVDCDRYWETCAGNLSGWVGDRPVEITIRREAGGRWWLNGTECTGTEVCTDLDLNFTPSTNLLPIRRLGLGIGQEARVTAAWLRFPEFRLEPLAQLYRRTDVTTYRYECASAQFVAELEVDASGFVTRYPHGWVVE